jgi:hypothetical protein
MKGRTAMNKKSQQSGLVVRAMLKLSLENGERQNVLMFIQSCYAGRVRTYDLDRAVASLSKLTDEEQHALIVCIMQLT